jgi:hypothetical protein
VERWTRGRTRRMRLRSRWHRRVRHCGLSVALVSKRLYVTCFWVVGGAYGSDVFRDMNSIACDQMVCQASLSHLDRSSLMILCYLVVGIVCFGSILRKLFDCVLEEVIVQRIRRSLRICSDSCFHGYPISDCQPDSRDCLTPTNISN